MRNAPHRIAIASPIVTDADGAGVYVWSVAETVWGRYGPIRVEEQPVFEAQGVTASVRIPAGTPVADGDRVQVLNVPEAAGSWDIVQVRPNPDHVRLLVRRSTRGTR